MRTKVPTAFRMNFLGAEGDYEIDFQPTDDWGGVINVTLKGIDMQWSVDDCNLEDNGGIVLGGITAGSKALWNDVFWFELRIGDKPPIIRYWGNQVIWREDRSVASKI
ncbi:MAG TPA: hypothetical protein VIF12_08475 [Micavibrio sp.]|jgi:hypothetical protein